MSLQKIKKLSLIDAQKIAAGEVIERPANALKELVENAIDAQATCITIHVNDGGKSLIRVIDNGCGMHPADAQICFERHATSKLATFDDITTLSTFGFRGEALASIAAISKVSLVTKEATAPVGTKVTLESGTIL
jgi:DNA mismatch repair protein MutL